MLKSDEDSTCIGQGFPQSLQLLGSCRNRGHTGFIGAQCEAALLHDDNEDGVAATGHGVEFGGTRCPLLGPPLHQAIHLSLMKPMQSDSLTYYTPGRHDADEQGGQVVILAPHQSSHLALAEEYSTFVGQQAT